MLLAAFAGFHQRRAPARRWSRLAEQIFGRGRGDLVGLLVPIAVGSHPGGHPNRCAEQQAERLGTPTAASKEANHSRDTIPSARDAKTTAAPIQHRAIRRDCKTPVRLRARDPALSSFVWCRWLIHSPPFDLLTSWLSWLYQTGQGRDAVDGIRRSNLLARAKDIHVFWPLAIGPRPRTRSRGARFDPLWRRTQHAVGGAGKRAATRPVSRFPGMVSASYRTGRKVREGSDAGPARRKFYQ